MVFSLDYTVTTANTQNCSHYAISTDNNKYQLLYKQSSENIWIFLNKCGTFFPFVIYWVAVRLSQSNNWFDFFLFILFTSNIWLIIVILFSLQYHKQIRYATFTSLYTLSWRQRKALSRTIVFFIIIIYLFIANLLCDEHVLHYAQVRTTCTFSKNPSLDFILRGRDGKSSLLYLPLWNSFSHSVYLWMNSFRWGTYLETNKTFSRRNLK